MEKRHGILRWALTVVSILLLLALGWHCLDIYLIGNSPANLDENGLYITQVYRAEDVALRLRTLLPWAAVYVLLVCAASWLPALPGGRSGPAEPEIRLQLMKKRLTELPAEAAEQESFRKKVRLAAGAAVTVCAAGSLFYLLKEENFVSWDLEMVMGQMLLHTLPWVVAAFAVMIAASGVCRRSMEKEIGLLRGVGGGGAKAVSKTARPLPRTAIYAVLYVLAAVLIVLGIRNGGMRDVLVKAINICTECIGLG